MNYDDWLFKQADDYYGNDDGCEYDPDDDDSWCECTACINRRKYEQEEARADDMWKEEHCFEYINGVPR